MNKKKFESELLDKYTKQKFMVSGRQFLVSRERPNIEDLFKKCLENRSERGRFADEGITFFTEYYTANDILLFIWDSYGPMSSFGKIGTIAAQDGSCYLVYEGDSGEELLHILGRLEPGYSKNLLLAAIRDLMHDNGHSYDLELFGSLPTRTENHRPDIMTAKMLRRLYSTFLEKARREENFEASWEMLHAELKRHVKIPNHLKATTHALKTALSMLQTLGLEKMALGDFRELMVNYTPQEKSDLMDLYFSIAYREIVKKPTKLDRMLHSLRN